MMKHALKWLGLTACAGLAAAVLTFSGCKKDEEEKSGVVGLVAVDAPNSPSGATARLYQDPSPAFGNNTVWWVTSRQPAVGFRYNPQAAFDWRAENALLRATTTVAENGEFNFAGMTEGLYILVIEKPGFGWSSPMPIELNQPTLDVGTIRLYPEEELNGVTAGNRTLQANRHYIIPDFGRFTVAPGDSLRIEPGAFVRGGDGALLRVQGTLIAEGQADRWIVFTSNLSALRNDDWEGIQFQTLANPGEGRFRYAAFRYCAKPIRTDGPDIQADYCYFSRISDNAIYASASKTVITRCVFNGVFAPVVSILPDSLRIEHNIIYSARILGMELKRVSAGSIFCNWFEDCGQADTSAVLDVGVILLQDCRNLDISRNNFMTSWFAFNIQGSVLPTTVIHNNRFDRMIRVIDLRGAAFQGPSYPVFRNNCMLTVDGYFVFIHTCGSGAEPNIDGRFNYWNSTSEDSTHRKINDCRDNPNCPCVETTPIEMACQVDAGICAQ